MLENGKPLNEQLAWLYENLVQLNEIDRSVILLLLDGLGYKE
ncbi:MAG TPA: hypothetical protein VG738_14575 [Chitinophagaceae bacterium]|nr:hypothetical protein [Chitinophagaceae bacterium]